MKKSVLVSLFLVGLTASVSANCQTPGEIFIPSLEDQIKMADEINFENLLNYCKNSEQGAGELMLLHFRGAEYKVDRRSEPKRPRTPGNPPPRMTVSDFLGSVSADSQASMRISVKENFAPDGTLVSREWSIDFGGTWHAETGMQDANDKAHK